MTLCDAYTKKPESHYAALIVGHVWCSTANRKRIFFFAI